MFQVIFAIFLGVCGIVSLFLAILTLAASGLGHGPGKVERRVIRLSFLAGVALIGLAIWLGFIL